MFSVHINKRAEKYSKSNFCVLSDWMEQHLMVKQCYKSLERLLFTFSPFILFQSFVWPKHWKIQGKWFRIHIYFLQQLILAYVFKLHFRTKVRKHSLMLKPLHFNSRPQNLLQKSKKNLFHTQNYTTVISVSIIQHIDNLVKSV